MKGTPAGQNGNIHCSPIYHISDSVSSEGQSPEDTRFPNDRISPPSNDSSTVRLESPRQTQYAYRNIDLAAREARSARPFFPDVEPQPLHGIFNADSWNGGGSQDASIGLNPSININISGFDTEMLDAQNSSTGFTPQSGFSYHQASSNTSYSPPNLQDDDTGVLQASTMAPVAGTMDRYPAFSSSSSNMFAQNPGNGEIAGSPMVNNAQAFAGDAHSLGGVKEGDLFKNMQGWDIGSSSEPLQGMTPGGEWEKMMNTIGQGMGWGMTPNTERTG